MYIYIFLRMQDIVGAAAIMIGSQQLIWKSWTKFNCSYLIIKWVVVIWQNDSNCLTVQAYIYIYHDIGMDSHKNEWKLCIADAFLIPVLYSYLTALFTSFDFVPYQFQFPKNIYKFYICFMSYLFSLHSLSLGLIPGVIVPRMYCGFTDSRKESVWKHVEIWSTLQS